MNTKMFEYFQYEPFGPKKSHFKRPKECPEMLPMNCREMQSEWHTNGHSDYFGFRSSESLTVVSF